MKDRRRDRARTQRRLAVARAVDRVEAEGADGLEDLLFLDEDDLLAGFGEALEAVGLFDAAMAWAGHLEEDGDLWRRRLALTDREPGLRARRAELDEGWRSLLRAHFVRWGAAGVQGERIARMEAELALAALRGAERLWLEGGGRPLLPILAQEALATLWPALYGHARKGR